MKRSLTTPDPATVCHDVDGVRNDQGPVSVPDLLAALQAIGASPGHALGQVAALLGVDAIRAPWDEITRSGVHTGAGSLVDGMHPEGILKMLDALASADADTANALLAEGLLDRRIQGWNRSGFVGLFLDRKPWITSLPTGMRLHGEALYMQNCTSLKALPEGLCVEGALCLAGCSALEALPSDLHRWHVNVFDLKGCTSLRAFPPYPHFVRQGLDFGGCASLETLPDNLRGGAAIRLDGCVSLRELPRGLEATAISLHGCTALVSIPEGTICRAETLGVTGCVAWDGFLPQSAPFGWTQRTTIHTEVHPEGISLGQWHERHPFGERPWSIPPSRWGAGFLDHLCDGVSAVEGGFHFEEGGCHGMALALHDVLCRLDPLAELWLQDDCCHASVKAFGSWWDHQGRMPAREVPGQGFFNPATFLGKVCSAPGGWSADDVLGDKAWAAQAIGAAMRAAGEV